MNSTLHSSSSMKANPAILELNDISIAFGGVEALKNIQLSIPAGQVVALTGDNGAGKSTLIKIISGVYQASKGSMHFNGTPMRLREPHDARQLGIETIYQDLALADNLDVGSNIFLGREPVLRRFGLNIIDRKKMREVALQTLARLDIDIPAHKIDGPVKMLSGGQRQAIAIGRAIYWNAKLLIMDEPTAALGVPEQRKVIELIQLLKSQGVTIILISHHLHDIFAVADRILVLRRGELVGDEMSHETDGERIVNLMVGSEYATTHATTASTPTNQHEVAA